jgi:hypothetical protein
LEHSLGHVANNWFIVNDQHKRMVRHEWSSDLIRQKTASSLPHPKPSDFKRYEALNLALRAGHNRRVSASTHWSVFDGKLLISKGKPINLHIAIAVPNP